MSHPARSLCSSQRWTISMWFPGPAKSKCHSGRCRFMLHIRKHLVKLCTVFLFELQTGRLFLPWISSHISAESAEVFIFPPKNRLAGNRGRMLVIPQTKDEHRGCSILTSNSLITAICFSLITLNRLGWMRSRKTSSPECVSLLEGCFYLIYTLSYWWNAADCDTSPPTHTLTDTLASSSA